MRTDAARGVYARRGNLPVLGGKIWLILYCLRRSFVQMTVCRYGAYCRRWKIVRSSIKSGGLPGYPESTYSGPGLRGLHLRDGRSANGRRTFFIRKWEPYRLLRERELYVAAEKVKNTFMGTCSFDHVSTVLKKRKDLPPACCSTKRHHGFARFFENGARFRMRLPV